MVRRSVEMFDSAEAVLGKSASELRPIRGVGPQRADRLKRALDETLGGGAVERELAACGAAGVVLVAEGDGAYPRLLRLIDDAPLLLWVRGELAERDALAVGIVGSRRCTLYGREQAGRFGRSLAQAGVTVVSGGAYGIDAAAHDAALEAGGRTLAVIGSGLARPYPKEHHKLFDRIADGGGALMSELPMDTPPQGRNFPARNRIISGLSLAVLVIEAAARSGALITARQCVEDHGRELMVLPGRVDSATSVGCHKILREGWASLVTTPAEAVEVMEQGKHLLVAAYEGGGGLPESLALVEAEGTGEAESEVRAGAEAGEPAGGDPLLAILDGPMTLDELVAGAGLGAGEVQSRLTMLELQGKVVRRGGRVERKGG
jgi:DNA processing protein